MGTERKISTGKSNNFFVDIYIQDQFNMKIKNYRDINTYMHNLFHQSYIFNAKI